MARTTLLAKGLSYFVDSWKQANEPYKAVPPPRRSTGVDVAGAHKNEGTGGTGDIQYYLRLAATNPYFFAAVSTIADRVADTKSLMVQERDGAGEWVDDPSHEFMQLLESPNSIMSGNFLMADTSWWMKFLGNSYWYFRPGAQGSGKVLEEIWPLVSDRVMPDPRSLHINPLTGKQELNYKYHVGGDITIPGYYIAHFRDPNPFDFWVGLSPLTAMQTDLKTDKAQGEWLGSFFGEGNAIPSSVISLPEALGDVEFDQVKADIVRDFGGKKRTLITRAGEVTIDTIQHSVDELRVLEGRTWNEKTIRSVLKVPPAPAGDSSGEARLAYDIAIMRDAVQPMLVLMAGFLNKIVKQFYGDEYQIVAQDIVPGDKIKDAQEYAIYAPHRTLKQNATIKKDKPFVMTGALAPLQQIIDEVPVALIPLAAQMLGLGAASSPTVDTMQAPTLRVLDMLTGPTQQRAIDHLTGANGEQSQPQTVLEHLASKAMSFSDEEMAVVHAMERHWQMAAYDE